MLIVFEGIDGSGKTTQAKMLAQKLALKGLKVHYSKEPTDGPIGSFIRQKVLLDGSINDPRAVALLYAADRSMHLKNTDFSDGVINIFDRFFYSSIAYQGALGVPLEYILTINSFAPKPDLVFLLDVDPAVGLKRLNRFDKYENLETLIKVRHIYLDLAEKYGMIVVDASKSLEEISEKIYRIVEETLSAARKRR